MFLIAGEIATAFVRIRPNMSGFKSETESGVKSAFSGIAKIVGVAFGATEAFRFGEGIIKDAADVQKQIEAVRADFGAASRTVLDFGDKAAAALGISATAADTTSARFGMLFRNMRIAPGLAAAMTVNLQKLAGSIAAIRGIDPGQVLASLPLALSGNVRGLRQYGISLDQTQEKLAALKLGLISSVKEALTPATRAEAIYALATANLGRFQEQAKKHAGDFANVQRRLSAEWSNAKGILGAALLPVFTRYARELERWLSRMQKSGKLQDDFNRIARTTVGVVRAVANVISTGWSVFQTATGWIGGTKTAIVTLFAVLAINKLRAFAGAIVDQLINNGFNKLKIASAETRTAFIADQGAMGVAVIGLRDTIRIALIQTGIGALVVAVGIAVGYIVTHWDTVKRYTIALAKGIIGTWSGIKDALIGFGEIIAGSLATSFTFPFQILFSLVGYVADILDAAGVHVLDFVHTGQRMLDSFSTDLVKRGFHNVTKSVGEIGSGFAKGLADGLKEKVKAPDHVAVLKKIGTDMGTTITGAAIQATAKAPAAILKSVADATKAAIEAATRAIDASVESAKKNLDTIGQRLAQTVNKILDKLGLLGGAIAGSPQAVAFKKLRDLIAEGAPSFEISRASRELSSDLSTVGKTALTAQKEKVKAQFLALTEAFNKGQISLAQFNRRVAGLLASHHVSYKNAGKLLGKAFADGFRENVKALGEQAAAIAAVPAKYRRAGGADGGGEFRIIRPLEVMRRENQQIARIAERQRERIAKAAEKTAVAASKTAAELKTVKVAPLPGQKGHASQKARAAAATGAQP